MTMSSQIVEATSPFLAQPGAAPGAAVSSHGQPTAVCTSEVSAQGAQHGTPKPRLDGASITGAIAELNDYLQHEQRALHFSVDDTTGQTVIKVTDTESDQVIRQIPPEEILSVMRSLAEGQGEADPRGLLMDALV